MQLGSARGRCIQHCSLSPRTNTGLRPLRAVVSEPPQSGSLHKRTLAGRWLRRSRMA